MSEIRKELEKACKVEQDEETISEYLIVLAEATEELSDKKWDTLSEPAQEWVNEALTKLDAEDPIPNFPDAEEEEEAPKKKERSSRKNKVAPEPEPDEEEEEPPFDTEEEEPEEEEENPKKPKKKATSAPEPEEEVSEEDPEDGQEDEEKPKKKKAKPPKARKNSAISRIQYFACKHPNYPVEKVGEKVREEFPAIAEATIRIQYSITHNIMNTLKKMGWSQ